MKMKLIIMVAVFILAAGFQTSNAQSCDSLVGVCKKELRKPSKKDPKAVFISDGQTYRAFLDEEQVAEFYTTFFKGGTYRIAASAGINDNYLIFEVYDTSENLIFSSAEHGNTPSWDFKTENTLDIVIRVKLDTDRRSSGCGVMLIGFKQKK
jgi:hypothetical protein